MASRRKAAAAATCTRLPSHSGRLHLHSVTTAWQSLLNATADKSIFCALHGSAAHSLRHSTHGSHHSVFTWSCEQKKKHASCLWVASCRVVGPSFSGSCAVVALLVISLYTSKKALS
ncbi:hypothetical protein GQ54DRAFT_160728 [Martensiomyces pterosporus]|nr:hypothetical protein GQ54DRAFT_160728 [Martensiomyces pterosporus]